MPPSGFLDKVARTITRHHLFARGERVLVAVSGGPDSMALLEALSLLAGNLGITLAVAHLDHELRGAEGIEETRFVEAEARKRGLAFRGGREDVRSYRAAARCSLEEAAREVRSRFLLESSSALEAVKIALGHTASDQAETVLLNLLRGAGRRGLAAMPLMRQGIWVRPLLECQRSEVEIFLAERSLPFVVDPTNALSIFRRNRVRHELLPRMEEEFGPGVTPVLARSAAILGEEEELLDALTRQTYERAVRERSRGEIVLDREQIAKHPLALRRRVVRRAATESGLGRGLTFNQVSALLDLVESPAPGAEVILPGGLRAQREYDLLRFTWNSPAGEITTCCELPVPGSLELPWGAVRLTTSVENREGRELPAPSVREVFFDADAVEYPLQVRSRLAGDRFEPLGGPGGKKLKKFFIDEKLPRRARAQVPLVLTGERILWVVGLRLSRWARPGKQTRSLLRIRAEALNPGAQRNENVQ